MSVMKTASRLRLTHNGLLRVNIQSVAAVDCQALKPANVKRTLLGKAQGSEQEHGSAGMLAAEAGHACITVANRSSGHARK